uniref:GIY-YIG domain-containing protein n=1 Tax=Rhabditophanes sp. KR3021 TaxID=114890 RepID=A0AC35UH76_9BILA
MEINVGLLLREFDKFPKYCHLYVVRDAKRTIKYVAISASREGEKDDGHVRRIKEHREDVSLAMTNERYKTPKESEFADLIEYARVVVLAISKSRPELSNCGTSQSMEFVMLSILTLSNLELPIVELWLKLKGEVNSAKVPRYCNGPTKCLCLAGHTFSYGC